MNNERPEPVERSLRRLPRSWVAALVVCLSPPVRAEPVDPLLPRVEREVADAKRRLGDGVGIPEVPDAFVPIPASAAWLTPAEAARAFVRSLPKLEKLRWWRIGLDPTTTEHALREPAEVIIGCLAVHRAGLEGADRALRLALEAGEFLLWAQEQAGTGVFPFPAVRRGRDAAFASAERFLSRAERAGRLGEFVRRGWVIDDAEDGGLQFDHGEAGVAVLELHAATGDPRFLRAALRAADWAEQRPIVRNWNYNSFSVYLLARAFAASGERRYLEAARRKALVGVMPGQLTDGPRAGRWLDPHNARPAYHYIMMRALAELVAVLPAGDPARDAGLAVLRRGLIARNRDFTGPGAPNKDKALDALQCVHRVFAAEPEFIRATGSDLALDALGRLASDQWRRGKDPLGPRGWGQFLALAAARRPE